MHERQTQEQIEAMLADAEDRGSVAAGRITVDAMDLVRVLREVQDHRADESQGATAFVRITEWLEHWAGTEAGARAAHRAWFDSMSQQHRDVSRHAARWDILEPLDQALYSLIAQHFVNAALESVDGRGAPDA